MLQGGDPTSSGLESNRVYTLNPCRLNPNNTSTGSECKIPEKLSHQFLWGSLVQPLHPFAFCF